jgi:hypothetical protein
MSWREEEDGGDFGIGITFPRLLYSLLLIGLTALLAIYGDDNHHH